MAASDRPCHAKHPDPAATAETCHHCKLGVTNGRYQKFWELPVTAPKDVIGTGRPGTVHRPRVALPCVHEGGVVSWAPCGSEFRHVRSCGHPKADWDTCVRGPSGNKEVKSCGECEWKQEPPPADGHAQIVVSADGIGDHLMAMTVAAGWRAANPGKPLTLVAKPWCAGWVDLFDADCEVLTEADPRLPHAWVAGNSDGWHFVEAAARAPWRSLPKVRELPADATAWAEQFKGCIVLAPFSLGSSARDWLLSHWRALEADLRKRGLQVVAIGTTGDALRLASFTTPLAGLAPTRAAALMKAAACVVSNESGMAHLAGALGVPAVVLAAQLDGRLIHGFWPKTRILQGPLPCSGCHWGGWHYRAVACDHLCANLQAIPPEVVLQAVAQILHPPPDRRETFAAFLQGAGGLVVETGCQRQHPDPGAGESTTLFGAWLAERGGRLVSLDNDEAHCELARRLTSGLPVEVAQTDSVGWLRAYSGEKITGLYLDALDADMPGHAEHCLAEAQAALPHLSPTARVLIDDSPRNGDGWAGKGRLAIPWLIGQGWAIEKAGHQCLLALPPAPAPPGMLP